MGKLSVNYLGLELSSPIIASSSGMTSRIESIKELEAAGAGAVVLKSLFEEQILGEIAHTDSSNDFYHTSDYLNTYIKENNIANYISLVQECKKECNIPIIASICCTNGGEWVEFAKEIESAGADAIELNVFFMPTNGENRGSIYVDNYFDTVAKVVNCLTIPVSVKISRQFTNPINIARELYFRGAKGIVMFNRLYDIDINIETMEVTTAEIFSNPSEIRHPLRWIAMSSATESNIDYSASTGVHTGEDAVKMLLAGAKSVQVCSAIYKNGAGEITNFNNFIEDWMKRHNYTEVSQFIGAMNYKNHSDSVAYERTQFMKYYSSYKG